MLTKDAIAEQIIQLFSDATIVGFSGSRSPSPESVRVCGWASAHCATAAAVGDARGIDAVARQKLPQAEVFRVENHNRSGFALRSIRCIERVSARAGLWCFFPAAACPAGLVPTSKSRLAFSGRGSGTWASAAYAAGVGCSLLCWVPAGVDVPHNWGLSALGRGWFLRSGSLTVQGNLCQSSTKI